MGVNSRACVVKIGCLCESKSFAGVWWDDNLSVCRMRDHMMGTGNTPKINTLLESWGVVG